MNKKQMLVTSLALGAMVAFAVPVFAADNNSERIAPTRSPIVPDLACLKTAVSTRETALSTAFSALSASVSSAYATRASDLAKAYDMTNARDRRTAVRTAFSAFRKTVQSARRTLQSARKAAWNQFSKDTSACRGVRAEEKGDQGADNLI